MKLNKFTRLCASWAVFLALCFPNFSSAQDCMCMGGTQLNPEIIHPDASCEVTFSEDDLDDLTPCLGPFVFYVIEVSSGDTIAFDTNSVTVDAKLILGITFRLAVEDLGSNGTCFSFYEFIDDTPPVLNCPSDVVTCTEFPDSVLSPNIIENCGIVVLSGPVDSVSLPDCMNGIYKTVFRDYSADDGNGNIATCRQTVEVLLSDTADVVFPKDTILNCGQLFDPTVAGRPTLNGAPFFNNILCNLQLLQNDDVDTLDCGDLLVLREWIFIDDCDPGVMKKDTQLIKLVDTIPPVFTFCTPVIMVNADQNCMANPLIPVPNVTDNCSTVTIQAILNNNVAGVLTNQGFVFSGLTEGTYDLTFIATDGCGNVDSCLSSISVVDVTTPNAVCDGGLVVTLDNNGCAFLYAADVDDGSNDACGGPLTFKIRRGMTGTFENFIKLNCADALLDSVLVTLQVIDATNPTSTNICMVGVKVMDKRAPELICPLPVTVDCGFDYSDLSVFGQPSVLFDACGVTVVLDSLIDIENSCGTGTITRMWTVTDPSGNESFCTQTITVENQTPYDGSGIVWPQDYVATVSCTMPSELEPTDLPAGFDVPVIPADPCAMIATSYKDQLFYIDFPACYKIVRTWKVIDWCHATDINGPVGVWTDQQVIAIMDTTPPTITSCPANGTFGLNAACTFASVTLTPVTATALCPGEDIIITNDSPYANSNGADASGNYPEGVHTITFKVKDGCGNMAECSVTITVADTKVPTPFCKDGIIGELQFMPNANPEIMAFVNASQLNYNSSDNCTAAADLVYTMRIVGDPNPPTASTIVFDCAGEGTHNVEIWVTDESGNSDFCVTKIHIQDNMNLCPDTLAVSNGTIGGGIQTSVGVQFPEVHVDISAMNMSYMTDAQGKFAFHNLAIGNDYTIEPWKNDGPKNGVTTYDIVIMTRHILNIQPIADPYKLIAADVNNSGSVTTFDVVELRKLILGIYQSFPNNNSWRFVSAGHVFPNPNNPFSPPFPEVFNVNNFSNDITNGNFIGVKIGDLNGSATVNYDEGTDNRNAENLNILIEDRKIEAGETFTVPFRSARENSLLALQFTLEFETDLELQGVEKGMLASVAGDRFVTSNIEDGIMTGTWYHTSPVMATTEDALFSLRFVSKKSGMLSEMIALTSRITEAVAYDDREIEMNLNLEFSNPTNMTTTYVFQLLQNQPNPFKRVTNIGFTLPETGPAKLTIYDVSGNVLKAYDEVYQQGYNEVSIMRQELPIGGVLFYKLQTQSNTATKKMILLQ